MGKVDQLIFDPMRFKSLVVDQHRDLLLPEGNASFSIFSSVEITYGFRGKPILPNRFSQGFLQPPLSSYVSKA